MAVTLEEIVCLRRWEFSETSQTVELFCRGQGIVRAIAKGARRPGGAFGGGLDLLVRGEGTISLRRGGELSTLASFTPLEEFRHLRKDRAANRAAFYATDMLGRIVAQGDPHPSLYDAFVNFLQGLGSTDPTVELLRMQWALLVEGGIQPRLDACEGDTEVVVFSARHGAGELRETGTPGWPVRRRTLELLRDLAAGRAPAAAGEDAVRACRLLAAYLREAVGEEPPTMRECFPDLPRPQ